MSDTSVISVGIDIGTSTTQVIFSSLTMENTASFFSIPRISIVDKKVVYKSAIYTTPLFDMSTIDGEAVRRIVAGEFEKAGISPSDTGTGAVIITGESARKDNAATVLKSLSDFAGDFVVSTAGPDLEAIIAGKGSGAQQYSKEEGAVTVNLDIGGGTTNIVLFDNGETGARGCVDIGGRQVKIDHDLTVTYISESAKKIAEAYRLHFSEGKKTTIEELRQLCAAMADVLEQLLGIGKPTELLYAVQTGGSTRFAPEKPIKAVCFSGGVADCVYKSRDDLLQYGDIGVLLGEAIRNSRIFGTFQIIEAKETIRATVVGAGTYTTSISGSTIDYTEGMLPLKNVPVLKLNKEEQERCFEGDREFLADKVKWFLNQSDSDLMILGIDGKKNPSYKETKTLAETIAAVADKEIKSGLPIIAVIRSDMAKALGQIMRNMLPKSRPVVIIDSIYVEQNDFIDMGKPLMNGLVIPVVVKTLIFG